MTYDSQQEYCRENEPKLIEWLKDNGPELLNSCILPLGERSEYFEIELFFDWEQTELDDFINEQNVTNDKIKATSN